MAEAQPYRCACLLLAAGGSRRLGVPKQLLRLEGETLIHRAARLGLEAGFSPVCVVLGSEAARMRAALDDCNVLLIENANWQRGMSTSLRAGIEYILALDPSFRHVLVMVCDQVQLTAEVLIRLRTASAKHRDCIVGSAYDGHAGVPAIFPAAYFSSLCSVVGDRGARGILEQECNGAVIIEFPGGAADIDTTDDACRAGLLHPAAALQQPRMNAGRKS